MRVSCKNIRKKEEKHMGLFAGCGPVFLKEASDASVFIEKMKQLSAQATGECKKEIEKQIKIADYGLAGEENIAFELKNSGMDMFILHDIYLEYEELSAQIDYLIVAKKNIYIIECKNLIGNIEIDNKGTFIRSYELYGKKIKEGIYSPITQNERHMNVIKAVRKNTKNAVLQFFFEKNFEKSYKSIVCLANPKTVLTDKYAKKEVKEKVVRADQLIALMKQMEKESKNEKSTEKEMRKLAEFFLEVSKPNKSDYTIKYEEMVANLEKQKETEIVKEPEKVAEPVQESCEEKTCPRCGGKLVVRMAKRGEHVGNQFYGCENFPKCWYREDI